MAEAPGGSYQHLMNASADAFPTATQAAREAAFGVMAKLRAIPTIVPHSCAAMTPLEGRGEAANKTVLTPTP